MGPHRYYEDDGPSFCRDNTRGHGYPLSHDRDLPPAPLHISYETRRALNSNHDIRVPENHSDQDTNARPRSRIPVAVSLNKITPFSISLTTNFSAADAVNARYDAAATMEDHVPTAKAPATSSVSF